ncbi:PREDICTED: protein TRM32-like isoform X2 [Lupinus angustifolius]|uniref:protein TRM32-like isoform X2 n=1 Tax=Lupinus angustifolius TaxID=3871 RepID=UPI00092FD6D2|nr:PREDICTED: protein TRM32-like isoform X2 [Lupinus angustifolius]
MVKQHLISSKKNIVEIEGNSNNNNQGCMWGILHILDYHHWHVKRVLPHKRHDRYKKKTILHNQGEKDQLNRNAEAEPFIVGQHGKKMSATGKSSSENRKKGRYTKESLHLEYSGENQANSENTLNLEKDGKSEEASLDQTYLETNIVKRDISDKLEKHNDILKICGVEKDLLLKFLHDLDVSRKKLQASSNKSRLTKSGSFPLTESSKMRSVSTRTFKHKQTEIWAFPKGEKLLVGTQAPKISASTLVKDVSNESSMEQKPSTYSRSSQGLNHKGWNQLVLHSFKVIKQKIKHALVEAIHRRYSLKYSITNDEKVVSQILDDGVIQECEKNDSSNETKAYDYDSNKHEVRLMRRTSSLNESLDRYTQLFEKSFSNDVKWHSSKSKSLRLTNEDKVLKSGNPPKFSRSNFSLPSLESLRFILHEVLLDTNIGDTVETDNHVQRKSVSFSSQTDKPLNQIEENEIAETVEGDGKDVNSSPLSGKIVEEIDRVTRDRMEDKHEIAAEDGNFRHEKVEISITIYPNKEVVACLETCSENNTIKQAKGGELNDRSSIVEESESDLAKRRSVDSFEGSSSKNASVTAKDTNTSSDKNFLLHKSVTNNNSDFMYVKKILEVSGFMENEQNQIWHTLDQPLKPSLLKDLYNEIDFSGEEIVSPYDHQLLFNLVNEVLIQIDEMSPTYFPRPFSFNYRLRPTPKEYYLLNEVWTSVNSFLSLRPELDQTLDDVVSRDLAKGSGWMNLQQEEEYVALELEEMIVDDLLDELVFS